MKASKKLYNIPISNMGDDETFKTELDNLKKLGFIENGKIASDGENRHLDMKKGNIEFSLSSNAYLGITAYFETSASKENFLKETNGKYKGRE